MLIRYGYEIAVNCPQPTPMVCLLSVSEDRKADMRVAEKPEKKPAPAMPHDHGMGGMDDF